jgi:hypothetical protein
MAPPAAAAVFATAVFLALGASCAEPATWSSPELDPIAVVDSIPTDTIRADDLARAPALPVSEIFRVTGDDYTYIRSLDVAGGRVYVSDEMNSFVRIYDLDGRTIAQFGGKGDGPGELDRIFLLTVTNDSVLVIDQRGLNVFDGDGGFVQRYPVNLVVVDARGRIQMRSFPRSLAATGKGLIISEDLNPNALNPEPGTRSHVLRLHTLNPDGTVGPEIQSITGEAEYPFGRYGHMRAHFSPEVYFAIAPDARVLVTDGDGTTFDVYRDGRRVRRVRFDVEQRHVTRNDLDELFEYRRKLWKRPVNGTAPDDWEEYDAGQRQIPHYSSVPVVGVLLASRDMILVNRTDLGWAPRESNPSPLPSRWTALSPEHNVLGSVELPPGFVPLVLREGIVAGTIRDDFDVPTVIAYRIGNTGHSTTNRND